MSYILFGFLPSLDSTLPPLNSLSKTSLECCFASSEVLGLLRLALWPPTMLPGLDMLNCWKLGLVWFF